VVPIRFDLDEVQLRLDYRVQLAPGYLVAWLETR
jgi:hypothetical protein